MSPRKRVIVATGGGDCPGLNAVIRGIVKRAQREKGWEVLGSREAFNGILKDPQEIMLLDSKAVAGIHVRGGTIIGTTNKGGPFAWPTRQADGTWLAEDRSDEMVQRLYDLNVEAIINIGGDGSQRISQQLIEKGLNMVGVPKTIDNDLSATDITFGFRTAVEIATDAVDKLVTTAESHNRVMILEVMGRDAGWIALNAAVAGGAEVCLIPEIPYDIYKVKERLESRYNKGMGFANIVVAEGAKPKDGEIISHKSTEVGYENVRLGGIGHKIAHDLEALGLEASIRVTVLGHLQRGGVPLAYDRILATQFGVRAFELVLEQKYGYMVAFRNNTVTEVPILEAISEYNTVSPDSYLLHTAKMIGMSLGE